MKYLSIFDVVIDYLIASNHYCTVYSSDMLLLYLINFYQMFSVCLLYCGSGTQ